MLREAKDVPCTDCGGRFPAECMDFDHLPEYPKSFGFGGAVQRSEAALREEMAKCEVVCANCHRIRTRERRNEKKQ